MGLLTWNLAVANPQSLKLARISQFLQLGTALLLVPILFLICQRLPVEAGWENGPVEMTQNFMLAFAGVASLGMAFVRRTHVQRYFWLAAALIWLLILGRELAWGAAWHPPLWFHPEHGPFISSRHLSYRPLVPYVGSAVLLLAIGLCLLARPGRLLAHARVRKGLMPWGSLLSATIYALISTYAERSADAGLSIFRHPQVGEEVFETGAYFFLARTQLTGFLRWLK